MKKKKSVLFIIFALASVFVARKVTSKRYAS